MAHQSSKVKQLIILSGKGGTGKTSLVAAFAHLSNKNESTRKAVYVDADVDAANLSLVLHPETKSTHEFWGGSLAEINPKECSGCGSCSEVCRYDAIFPVSNHSSVYKVDPIACDGCAACVYACPQSAISMVQQQEGHWYQSTTPFGHLFHAELFPGKENSGKLVTLVKQQARLWVDDNAFSHIVIDGPPGIGCPVISACAGTDLGLLVTEPGLSGLHDLMRVTGILKHFKVPVIICINKADIYPEGTKRIREFADEQSIDVVGEIPFDELIPQSMLIGSPITAAFPKSPSSISIRSIWERSFQALFDDKEV